VLKPDTQLMFERIFIDGAAMTSTRDLARVLQTNPSSLMSRFFRLELPSAKTYLAMGRLVLVAEAFEMPSATLTAVAHAFRYSSPQSFSRHTRRLFGLSAAQFRAQYDAEGMLMYFIEKLVRPYRSPLARLSPSGAHETVPRPPGV
jgi:AraC-like DNA-binding protein